MLKPLGDRVLVKPIEPQAQTTESGIELVEMYDRPVTMGSVYSCGPSVKGADLKPDAQVVFAPTSGEDVEFNGEPYIMLREKDILAVVEP